MKESCAVGVAPFGVAEADMDIRRIEPQDFDDIVAVHQKRIYRILLFMVRDADVADTLTQECFLRAFKKHSTFRGGSRIGTWLVRIAINLAHDHNRSRRWAFWRKLERADCVDTLKTADRSLSPEQALIHSESMFAIQSAVEKLPDRQKAVFLLRFVEDMPIESIAEATGTKLGTAKTHLYRAIETVKIACQRQAQSVGGVKK